jgi:hypothetical protein
MTSRRDERRCTDAPPGLSKLPLRWCVGVLDVDSDRRLLLPCCSTERRADSHRPLRDDGRSS